MSLEEFLKQPLKKEHTAYEKSLFRMKPAPEFATGEVLTASLYRSLGYGGISEKDVPIVGRRFYKKIKGKIAPYEGIQGHVQVKTWKFIVEKILQSPKQPNQNKKKFLLINPIIANASLYTSAARLAGNPWRPGALVERMVEYGCQNLEEAEAFWNRIYGALSVKESDDIWARFLQKEFKAWEDPPYDWDLLSFKPEVDGGNNVLGGAEIPAAQFVRDLNNIIELKGSLTRRQWISLFESVLRLGSAVHVLWLCKANSELWKFLMGCVEGSEPPDLNVAAHNLFSAEAGYWRYGEKVMPTVKKWARNYIAGRVGVNLLLTICEGKGISFPKNSLASISGVHKLGQILFENRNQVDAAEVRIQLNRLLDKNPKLLACTKGVTSNIVEFLRYSLGQRQTADQEARNYDQGYWVKKSGNYSAAPWVVSAGPVSLLALAHCCAKGSTAPKTIEDFCRSLGSYGISVRASDANENGLGVSLRNLGLVTDSPDAEGGMVVADPFAAISGGV